MRAESVRKQILTVSLKPRELGTLAYGLLTDVISPSEVEWAVKTALRQSQEDSGTLNSW